MASKSAPVSCLLTTSVDQLGPLVDAACDAWKDDPLFEFLSPNHKEYPEGFRILWKFILKTEFYSPGKTVMAAYQTQPDGSQLCVGFSVWERHGANSFAKSRQGDNMSRRVTRTKLLLHYGYRRLRHGSENDFSFQHHDILEKEMKRVSSLYPEERYRLQFLAVRSTAQGCGIGKRLLQWGIDRSEEERVPLTLEASAAGQPLYHKMGFQKVGLMKLEGSDIQQEVMVREPTMAHGRKA